jgi:hypothetical protein
MLEGTYYYYLCFLDIECGSVETIIPLEDQNLELAKDKARIELGLAEDAEPIGACVAFIDSGFMELAL